MRTLADYYKGLSKRDKEAFKRVWGADTKKTNRQFQTVAEYISTHNVKTEYRTSKKGEQLVKVFYENGTIKEYPVKHIDSTTAFEI